MRRAGCAGGLIAWKGEAAKAGAAEQERAAMIGVLNIISMLAGLALYPAFRIWVNTGRVSWIVVALVLCVPGCSSQLGWPA